MPHSDDLTEKPLTTDQESDGTPLLSVRNLSIEFATDTGWLRVTDDVSFDVLEGETLGLVGESGSGKTVTSLAVMGLIDKREGRLSPESSIKFQDEELIGKSVRNLNKLRGKDIAMIFQEPMASLNPAFTVGQQVSEAIRIHTDSSKSQAWTRAVEMLDRVGIPSPKERAKSYPHQFSGGMAQRVMIAMALACDPKLLIADEPTTALDVTVEADILDLLSSLKRDMGMGVLFVTHDLGVVQSFCNRAMVMYAGQVVAEANVDSLYHAPVHPYVEGLLASIPDPYSEADEMWSIPGVVPQPTAMPDGCRFHPRCSYAVTEQCAVSPIPLDRFGDRAARCVRVDEIELHGIKRD